MTQESKQMRGKVAIVTGAGKGLGRAWALHLANMGVSVVVNNRHSKSSNEPSSASSVVNEIELLGGRAFANTDSVEGEGAAQRMVDDAIDNFGGLDIVIANAGMDRPTSFHQLKYDYFEYLLDVNFKSVARLLHIAWPLLRENRYGRVLLTTSTAGLYGNFGQSGYSSAKAALQGLMQTLSLEGRSRNILVNSIAPYAFTQMTSDYIDDKELASLLTPEAIVKSVAFLVSEQCQLTGKTIVCGADQIRLAECLESDSVTMRENSVEVLEELIKTPLLHASSSATENFENFVQLLKSNHL